ncbi:hypothetical protein HUB98_01155 [Paenibacillus barcinonensis]|uniref:Uncharacterized protein n=1 Tax=Paenibacillus barcinonensis TaxID=198119 RepID=A0A2V4VBD0_PAEBA|nr:hypothetical protein [Paenibacillus barcinonensis]PYE42130.1 hypothetical protein DFQ00_1411 [Paenibacillus barcinonensis]QKS55053.1 hypothetical protein HUB98_01155 [Paenibacillus barcinonensis]
MRLGKRKILYLTVKLVILSLLTVYAYLYIKERPGGLADQMMSKAVGIQDNVWSIPIGSTPEDAVKRFRGTSVNVRVLHQEPVDGGMILFIERTNSGASSNLQLEYVRKTLFGWKWVWGGGYGTSVIDPSEYALHYMNMPELEGVETPFPMVFGTIEHAGVSRVTAENQLHSDDAKGETEAKIVKIDIEKLIWLAMLPVSENETYTIKVYDEAGKQVGAKQVEMTNDSGSLTLGKRVPSM